MYPHAITSPSPVTATPLPLDDTAPIVSGQPAITLPSGPRRVIRRTNAEPVYTNPVAATPPLEGSAASAVYAVPKAEAGPAAVRVQSNVPFAVYLAMDAHPT